MISSDLQRADSWVPKARGTSTIQPTEHIMDRYCPVLPASRHWDKEKTKPQAWPPRAPSLAGAWHGYKRTGVATALAKQKCPSESAPSGPASHRAFHPRKTRWWNQQMFVSPLKPGHPLCKAPPDGFSSRAVSQWDVAQQSGSWAGGLEGGKGMEDPAAGPSVLGPGKPARCRPPSRPAQ